MGGVTVGIYPTDSPQQVHYVMAHSGSRFYFAEDEEQLDKVLEVRETLPDLTKIIIYDMEGLRHFKDPMAMSFEELLELGKRADEREPARFESCLQETRPDDTAFLIYTSGTTGPPKGAMITHRNVLTGFQSQRQVLTGYMNDELLTFLPLCHIAERGVTAMGMIMNGWVCNFAEEMDTVPQDIREVSPTVLLCRAADLGEVLFRPDPPDEGCHLARKEGLSMGHGRGQGLLRLPAQPVGAAPAPQGRFRGRRIGVC